MDKYIKVTDIDEIFELKRKFQCYYNNKSNNTDPIVLTTEIGCIYNNFDYYKLNSYYCEFQKGQLVMCGDDEDDISILDVFLGFDPDYPHTCKYRCLRDYYGYCRLPRTEELKKLVPQLFTGENK